MKKVLLKRIFASTLAGTFALSLPLTAMAATGGGSGGTEGDASVVGGSGDFFSVVLPTNTASNVNFQIDPQNFLSKGLIEGIDENDYQKNTQLYFTRTDYEDMLMGNKSQYPGDPRGYASYYWGNIKNQEGSTPYGNTSNWMTVTNKSSAPVTVELKVAWSNADKVKFTNSPDEAKKSDVAAIYMEVQASEGRTGDFYHYVDKFDTDVDWNWTYKTRAYDKDGKELTKGFQTVGEGQLVRAYEPTENPRVLKLISMPAKTDANHTTAVTWVLPTVNQAYTRLHKADEVIYRSVDEVVSEIVKVRHQAYYLKAYYEDRDGALEVGGIELWDNRNKSFQSRNGNMIIDNGKIVKEGIILNEDVQDPFSPNDKFISYDESINMYPTYGFRLSGEASQDGWADLTDEDMPTISLSWKVTIGEPSEEKTLAKKDPKVWDGVTDNTNDNEIDIEGVMDDTEYYRVVLDNTTLSSIEVKAGDYEKTIWDSVNGSEMVNTDGFWDMGKLPMVTVQDVRKSPLENDGNRHDYRVKLNEILLHNYSQAHFFKDKAVVTLTFNFLDPDDKSGEPIPVTVYLRDSKNNVNEVQNAQN